jgi:hypothetical protein
MQGPAERGQQTAMRAVLAAAREKFAADLRTDVSVFDQPSWDVRGLRDRAPSERTRLCTSLNVGPWISHYPPHSVTL